MIFSGSDPAKSFESDRIRILIHNASAKSFSVPSSL